MIEIGTFLLMFVGTYFIGKSIERSHYRSIRAREQAFLNKPALTIRTLPEEKYNVQATTLALGSVVISVDYFKMVIAGLQLLVGGELKTYSSLIDRARREAILRMKQSCPQADLFINTRLETASISRGEQKTIGSIEVVCYATAVKLNDGH